MPLSLGLSWEAGLGLDPEGWVNPGVENSHGPGSVDAQSADTSLSY